MALYTEYLTSFAYFLLKYDQYNKKHTWTAVINKVSIETIN